MMPQTRAMTQRTKRMNLKEVWSKQEATLQERVVRERVEAITGIDCFVGLVRPTGAKMFQFDLSPETTVHANYLKRFRGIAIEVIQLDATQKQFTIFLLEDALEDVFVLFVEDVINSLIAAKTDEEALSIIHARVNHWKDLFAKLSGDTLTPEQQRGLYGELLVLKTLLSLPDKLSVLHAWQGPHGGNHDFVLNKVALEVKTTKAGSPSLGISNEMQLDPAGWKHLYVSLVVLSEVKGGADALSALIVEIRQLLSADLEALDLFAAKIRLAGIPDDLVEGYDTVGYHVRAIRHFHVKDGFPSIITTDIPDAVSEVRYQVDISGCLDFEIDETYILNSLL
jgi:hypothetical protein